jgi:gliding motility-associated-like protein
VKKACQIVLFVIAFLATNNTYAQTGPPKWHEPPLQVYTIGTPIPPLLPDYRLGSTRVPPNIYGEVTTFAGTGAAGGTNALRLSSTFNNPQDVKVSPDGKFLYVADAGNAAIRKINLATGVVSTFAGGNAAGTFKAPWRMVFDQAGNLFVTDRDDHTIRKITPAGVVSLYAGVPGAVGQSNNTFAGPIGITIDASDHMYVTDYGATFKSLIRQVVPGSVSLYAGGKAPATPLDIDGPGPDAAFALPNGIALSPDGNMYVTDYFRIRRISAGPMVTSVAGQPLPGDWDGPGPSSRFNFANGISIDDYGFMFLTDDQEIRRITPNYVVTNLTTDIAGNSDGVLKQASFRNPAGICVDNKGNIYVADAGNNLIRKISITGFQLLGDLPPGLVFDARTGIISGTPTQATPPAGPIKVSVVGYNKYGSKPYTVTIQINKAARDQQSINFPPFANNIKETDLDFSINATGSPPYSVTKLPVTYTSSDESIASIADGKIHILKDGVVTITAYLKGNPYYADATPKTQTLTIKDVPVHYEYPVVNPKPPTILIPIDNTHVATAKANQVATVIADDPGQEPLVIKLTNNVFTCADVGPQVVKIAAGYGPDPADPLNAMFNQTSGIVYDKSTGNIYISDLGNTAIRKIGTDTRVTTLAGGTANGNVDGQGPNARFGSGLFSIATDKHGNIFVCDVINLNVRKITPGGLVTSFATEAIADFNNDSDPFYPAAIAVDQQDNVYLADRTRIVKINPAGTVVTPFAGSLVASNLPTNDGTGTAALFSGITGLTFDKNGDLYVCSSDNDDIRSIRKVTPAGVVTTLSRFNDFALRFTGIVVDSDGNVFATTSTNAIYKFTPGTPNYTRGIFAGGMAGATDGIGTAAKFTVPQGISIDDDNNLYIADQFNHEVRKITPAGLVSTIAGSGESGYKDNTSVSNAVTKLVPVVVTSPIKIANHNNVVINVSGDCPVYLSDYTTGLHASSPCTTNFTYTQSPAVGSVLPFGQAVNVVITINDDLQPLDKKLLSFTVTAIKALAPAIAIAPTVDLPCDGAQITYKATVTNAGSHPKYKWTVNGTVQPSTDPLFRSDELKAGDVVSCTVTNTDGVTPGCTPATASNTVTLQTQPSATNTLSIISSIPGPVCPGTPIIFSANFSAPGGTARYQWQVNGQNITGTSSSYTSNKFVNGDVVTCLMTSGGRCVLNPVVRSNAITVSVRTDAECEIVKYNTFTPNGDGINDTWDIPVLVNYPNCSVSVFTRNGKLIFHSTGYPKAWDGTYNGSSLSAGVYYFLIDTKDDKPPLSGWITILR